MRKYIIGMIGLLFFCLVTPVFADMLTMTKLRDDKKIYTVGEEGMRDNIRVGIAFIN